MELFRLNLPSDDGSEEPRELSEDATTWAEMSLAFDDLRAALAKLGDPDEVIRVRREVTTFIQEITNRIKN